MNKKVGTIVVVLSAVLVVGGVGLAVAGNYNGDTVAQSTRDTVRDGNCTGEPRLRILDRVNLTDEQEQKIRDKVISMRENGANHTEIRDTVRDMVEDFGAELPDGEGFGQRNQGQGRGQGNGQGQRHRRGK